MTRVLLHDPSFKSAFHKVDVWHSIQLGQGKCYVASAIAGLLDIFEGSSVEAKLAAVTTEFLSYCRDSRHTLHNFFRGFRCSCFKCLVMGFCFGAGD